MDGLFGAVHPSHPLTARRERRGCKPPLIKANFSLTAVVWWLIHGITPSGACVWRAHTDRHRRCTLALDPHRCSEVLWTSQAKRNGGAAAPAAPAGGNNGKFNIQTYNAISPVGLEKYDSVRTRGPRARPACSRQPVCRTTYPR